ncbi:serine/threonine-protein kinase-like protein [Cocos nucifera]|uniref:Serine/threonine-protein kinase-like protein n=1 Tax=Cocos nucifera TaxID=13894 RepID=A0A8K0IUE8_COCNU|nr:serine/threonine-protein kinase-like protein [Cocos nucifera]
MGLFCCGKDTTALATTTTTTTSNKLRIFRHEELETATAGFSPSALLGRGSHGSVFLASLDGGRLLAAVKVPSDDDYSTFDTEIALLSSLPRSPLLVNLLGATPAAGPAPRIAVVDLMPLGSLHDHLHHPLRPPPPWPSRLRLALHAAASLAALHALQPPVAHRDVKPSNLLLDADGRTRLADFSLAVRLPPPQALPPAGTIGYLDPSYLRPTDLSTATDVYSFGVVLLEILTGRRAIDVAYSPPSLEDWAAPLVGAGRFAEMWDPRARPAEGREEEAAREVAVLATRCLAPAAEERPSMAEVVERLREAERRVRSPPPPAWRRLVRWVMGRARNGKVSDVAAT